ncbi:MAG TPA: YbfB/YjiJ family MFS transporter [Ramlibacter sp.]|nr:YbfB/YjiJ family MFS transporter [Ramlibacter sp.]
MHTRPQPIHVALAGMVALAVAMGIGRFAFTPLLPMMLADGVVDLAGASWLASANYLGYLVGALLCTLQPWLWRRFAGLPPLSSPGLVRAGLAATSFLTLGMALQSASLWPLLRFAAGVASAVVFLFTSGWCLAQLARSDATALGGLMYAGPGGGIVASGLVAGLMVNWHQSAATGWLLFGVLAAMLSAAVWPVFARDAHPVAAAGQVAGPAPTAQAGNGAEMALLTVAYGLAGFGYIITATFLPVIARQALPGSAWLDLFWPIFGVGVIAGALLSTRFRFAGDLRYLLAACYAMQSAGVAASTFSPTLAGFIAGSLLLGLPFTTITFFAMREARRLRPASPNGLMGLLTAMYGVGQIAGPPLAAVLVARSGTPSLGFALSLEIAAGSLVAGALLYLELARRYPMAQTALSPPGGRAAGRGTD